MKYFLFFLFVIFFCGISEGKNFYFSGKDSVAANIDSTSIDSVAKKKYDVDTIVYASSRDSIIFFIKDKKMHVYGNGELKYKETDLKSANIYVDFTTNSLSAEGIPNDSVPGKYKNTPVLTEKGEVYEGKTMKYFFKTSKGFITSAGSETDGAYYTGEKINKVDKDTYFIKDGIYTTCDVDTPHYHFYASEMKIINKEQIISRWIWLNFGGVPLPIPIPFAVFPIESGRRSGILPPAFGDDYTYGRYFSRFGYFWAINDYLDVNLTADYFTRGSYNLASRFRYIKRYNYDGEINLGYSNFKSGETSDLDRVENINWNIKWRHNQVITPTMRFDANLDFRSGTQYARNTTTKLNDLLNRDIISNANFYKTWEEAGTSLSIAYSRNQNLDNGSINEILPRVQFSKTTTYPFRKKDGAGEQKWYELFGFNYNGNFQNNRVKADGNLKIRGGFKHDLGFSFSPKFGHFNITPSLTYSEKWYNKRIVMERGKSTITGNDTVFTNDAYKISMVRTFQTGISAQTKLYGMFQPGVLGIAAVRHTIIPTVGYNYTPDFSKEFWGYYDSYKDSTGKEVKYDKFGREVYGGAGSGESQQISFSLSNIIEMKTAVDPTDTTSKEKKIPLVNFDLSTGYNFAADSLKFAPISLSFRTSIENILDFSGSTQYTLYDYVENKGLVNKFLVNEGKGLFRLTNLNFTISTSLSADKFKSEEPKEGEFVESPNEEESGTFSKNNNTYGNIYTEKEPDFTIPWSLSLYYSYNVNKFDPRMITKTSSLSGNFDFSITPTWKIGISGHYDFQLKEFAAPNISISKDLHCWLMTFTWRPTGTYRGYMFEIKVKAPQLQDLKLTKRDDFFSGK